jgi:peptidoglycan/xylan/chitin deacetylase (PgdA/CDA1 family)
MLVPTFVGALLYPPLVWYFERFDLHLVFAVVLSLIAIYKVLPGLPPREAETPGLRRLAIFRAVMARVAVGVVLMSLLALFFFNRYVYKGFGLQVEIFRRGSDEFRLVALTFDDGPNPEYTIPILDILCDEEVPATFFLIGSEVLKYPDIARRIVDAGHEVGNHTHTHRNMFGLPAGPMQHEIDEAEKAIEAATGVRPTLFRPPRGLYDSRLVEMLRERRYTLALWSVSSRDWAEVTEASMVQRLTRIVRNGDVILFHDGGSLVSSQGGDRTNTVSALPRLIANLRQRGFSFVTLSDLILISGLTGHDADLNGGE